MINNSRSCLYLLYIAYLYCIYSWFYTNRSKPQWNVAYQKRQPSRASNMFLEYEYVYCVSVCVCLYVYWCLSLPYATFNLNLPARRSSLDSVCRSGSCGKSSENAYEIRMRLRARLRMHKHEWWQHELAQLKCFICCDPVPGWGSAQSAVAASASGSSSGYLRNNLGCPVGCKHLQECSPVQPDQAGVY